MNAAGPSTVHGTCCAARCRSIWYFVSKWGMPVPRSAFAADVNTMCRRCAAASMSVLPSSTSAASVEPNGVVTANNIFLRSLGSALGVAVFGAMANAVVGDGAVDPARLTDAVHRIFIAMLLVSVVMVVLAGLIPSSADRVTAEPAPAQDNAASPAPAG